MGDHVVEMASGVTVRDCVNAGPVAVELTIPYSSDPAEDMATLFEALAHVIRDRNPDDVQVRGAVYSEGDWRLDVILYQSPDDIDGPPTRVPPTGKGAEE